MGMSWTVYESPLGPLALVADAAGALVELRFPGHGGRLPEGERGSLGLVAAQLDEYFEGARTAFELSLALAGTPLQMQVWRRLREIPYGETVSYGELAAWLSLAHSRPASSLTSASAPWARQSAARRCRSSSPVTG